ncbi:peptidase C3-like protein [Branchiibius hedensis]|uniref:Peptidase_C39 like family protein n=1 Tax=Branchiibius hedensis TaxID=672460 RepID=A0A2Y8ZXQ4_9MICO|nr:peptidase C39 family protein [Branchiibius hedensis]PWJ26247.1 peptidase C3-like protein [Branchiibius hedensis]SSA35059.1 Peptidase_C39 like family protein [Branchiibius hedensis]
MLVTSRPHTATQTIVDVVTDGQATTRELEVALEEVIASGHDCAATKLEVHPWSKELLQGSADLLASLGFVPSRAPLPSVASTLGGVEGWTRWSAPLVPAGGEPAPYIGQTTDFTCGAVSLLSALHRSHRSLLGNERDRVSNARDELRWWRKATNMPACDPMTLAVVDAEALGEGSQRPVLHLTSDEPVLVEGYEGDERAFRAQLQRASRDEADWLGIRVDSRWLSDTELLGAVRAGSVVQLLIDEFPMHGWHIPHWITAVAATTTASGQDALVVQDPWVDAEYGETWVSADHLAISIDDIQLMAQFGDPAYRAAIVLPASGH